ncbi:DUF2177 family protein [Sandarakinorhabdus sp.]|uniref:DUF2177 family protein n=1 Tax=Sandarakinorhabdus sp. TaxID=1916663 RepID=UPI00286DED8C|nr:DUF2177 family protein [Sandarakinorhabdus sp.]
MIARTLTAYVATGISFAVIDSFWLILMAPRLYKPEIGEMLAPAFRGGPAVVFYLLYIAGMLYFAVMPGLASGRWQTALLQGAVLGFMCYMTYDMTNYATLKVWSLKVTILDLIWGTVLTGLSAAAGAAITQRLFPS